MKRTSIPQKTREEARRLRQDEPKLTWREIGERVGIYGETIRECLRNEGRDYRSTAMRRKRRFQKIPVALIEDLIQFHSTHPAETAKKLATRFGVSASSVRQHIKNHSGQPTNQLAQDGLKLDAVFSKAPIDDATIAAYYLTDGEHNKCATGKRFNISPYAVSWALVRAGYPEHAYSSVAARHVARASLDTPPVTPPPIVTSVGQSASNGNFKQWFLDGAAYITSLETKIEGIAELKAEVIRLKQENAALGQWKTHLLNEVLPYREQR